MGPGKGQFSWMPEKSDHGPVSILFSSADKLVYVYRNGAEIGRAPFADGVRGMHVLVPSRAPMRKASASGCAWTARRRQ